MWGGGKLAALAPEAPVRVCAVSEEKIAVPKSAWLLRATEVEQSSENIPVRNLKAKAPL